MKFSSKLQHIIKGWGSSRGCCIICRQAEAERLQGQKSLLSVMLNINSVLTDGAAAMVDDTFLKCFTSASPDPWNWNFYLAPLW